MHSKNHVLSFHMPCQTSLVKSRVYLPTMACSRFVFCTVLLVLLTSTMIWIDRLDFRCVSNVLATFVRQKWLRLVQLHFLLLQILLVFPRDHLLLHTSTFLLPHHCRKKRTLNQNLLISMKESFGVLNTLIRFVFPKS